MDLQSLLEPLTAILLEWTRSTSLSAPLSSFADLTNAEFLFIMLSRVDGFRWVDDYSWKTFTQLPTGEKVKRMRGVGRSIARYYQQHLGLSLDNLAFNYIEMCTANPESDILRLFIAALGVLTHSPDIMNELQTFLSQLRPDQGELFKIMIDYASSIGEKIGNSDSPLKRQKKLVSKLQSVEEELEFYQQYTEQLQAKVQMLTEEADIDKRRIQKLSASGDSMIKKIEVLQTSNEQLNRQVQAKTRQQQLVLQRLANNRQAAQEIVDRLMEENEKERKEATYFKNQLAEKLKEELELRKIAMLCETKDSFIEELKSKCRKQTERIQVLEKQISHVNSQLRTFTIENEGLRIKVQFFQKSYPIDKNSFFSPEQQSIVISNRLGDSYQQKTPKQWFPVEEDRNHLTESHLSESLSFSQPTENSISYPSHMGYMNIKDLETSQEKENIDPNIAARELKLSDISEEKSNYCPDQCSEEIYSFKAELELAMTVIFDLQSTLQSTRKELLTFKNREADRADRASRFAQKVNDMFT